VCTQYVRVREGPIDQYQADNAGACAPIQLLLNSLSRADHRSQVGPPNGLTGSRRSHDRMDLADTDRQIKHSAACVHNAQHAARGIELPANVRGQRHLRACSYHPVYPRINMQDAMMPFCCPACDACEHPDHPRLGSPSSHLDVSLAPQMSDDAHRKALGSAEVQRGKSPPPPSLIFSSPVMMDSCPTVDLFHPFLEPRRVTSPSRF